METKKDRQKLVVLVEGGMFIGLLSDQVLDVEILCRDEDHGAEKPIVYTLEEDVVVNPERVAGYLAEAKVFWDEEDAESA